MFKMHIKGLKEGLKRIRALKKLAREAMEEVLEEGGEEILGEAVQLAPVDTGNLRGSKYHEPVKKKKGQLVKELGFNADYAFHVHENLTAYHEPPTGAKFLERPLLKYSETLKKKLAERIYKKWKEVEK